MSCSYGKYLDAFLPPVLFVHVSSARHYHLRDYFLLDCWKRDKRLLKAKTGGQVLSPSRHSPGHPSAERAAAVHTQQSRQRKGRATTFLTPHEQPRSSPGPQRSSAPLVSFSRPRRFPGNQHTVRTSAPSQTPTPMEPISAIIALWAVSSLSAMALNVAAWPYRRPDTKAEGVEWADAEVLAARRLSGGRKELRHSL